MRKEIWTIKIYKMFKLFFNDYLVLTIGKFSVISYPIWKIKKALFLKG